MGVKEEDLNIPLEAVSELGIDFDGIFVFGRFRRNGFLAGDVHRGRRPGLVRHSQLRIFEFLGFRFVSPRRGLEKLLLHLRYCKTRERERGGENRDISSEGGERGNLPYPAARNLRRKWKVSK